MNQFVNFLREYWFQLVTVLGFVFEIIFIFIKRKPKSVDDFRLAVQEVLACVPELVISRERAGDGDSKKREVIILCEKLIAKSLNRGLSLKECAYIDDVVGSKIETVLSTPTKKEVL